MNTLAINTINDELEAASEYSKANGLGLEVTAFAFPQNLEGDLAELIKQHKQALANISPILAHGPFLDLIATSMDTAIVDICRQRHQTALDAAHQIGATVYIAHTNYNPMIRNPSYQKNWTKRMLDFWLPFADKAGKNDMIICLENLWEPSPHIQKELIEAARHPCLRASFDNGHALVFSDVSSSSWIETLGPNLGHCHLHDNSGEQDEHKPVGTGKEDWTSLLASLAQFAPQAVLVAESDHLNLNRASIEKLKSF